MALSHVEFFAEQDSAGVANPTIAIPGVSWAAGDRLTVEVHGKDDDATVTSIAATGLTFSQVVASDDVQGQVYAELWKSDIAAGAGSGVTVTVTMATASHQGGLQATVLVHSGNSPDVDATATANTGAADTTAQAVDLTTLTAVTRCFYFINHRQRTFTVDSGDGLTQIRLNDFTPSAAGNECSTSSFFKDQTSTGTYNGSGTASSAADWVALAFSMKETGGGGGGGGAPLDARWLNFWDRGQAWYGFWQDAAAGVQSESGSITASLMGGPTVVARKQATGTVVAAGITAPVVSGRKQGAGAAVAALAQGPTLSGSKVTRVVTAIVSGSFLPGRKQAAGTGRAATILGPIIVGRKSVARSIVAAAVMGSVLPGRKQVASALAALLAAAPKLPGVATRRGAVSAALVTASSAPGSKTRSGSIVGLLASTPTLLSQKVGLGIKAAVITASALIGRKQAASAATAELVAGPVVASVRGARGGSIAAGLISGASISGARRSSGSIATLIASTSLVASGTPLPDDIRGTVGAVAGLRDTVVIAYGPGSTVGATARRIGSVSSSASRLGDADASAGLRDTVEAEL